MSAHTGNFKLGLFVLGGLLLLLGALFVFGASRFFEGKTVEETYVAGNVDGLKVGAPVTLRGVPVGEVTRINFTWNVYHQREPRYVLVEFTVHNNVSLVPPGKDFARLTETEVQKGLRARVKSQGLAGASMVSLEYVNPKEYPPLQVPWQPHNIYIPSAPGQFSEIIAALDKTMGRVKEIDFQQLGESVQRDLAAGERFLNHLDQANPAALGTNVTALLTDLRGVSAQLRAFIGNTNQQVQAANLQELSRKADQILREAQGAVGKLDRTLGNLDTTALNQSLENVQRATQDMEEAVRRLKQYPAGALFGTPPPPATSVEPPKK
jgi:paraquat-inducible protein B